MRSSESVPFIKMLRGDDVMELIRINRNAFTLLAVIAQRARRTSRFNQHNLRPGEAFLGDHQNYGMSEKEYRTAKRVLEKLGLAAFKGANKGTVATLTSTSIFDINLEEEGEQNGGQRSDKWRTMGDKQECKNEKNEKIDRRFAGSALGDDPNSLDKILEFTDQHYQRANEQVRQQAREGAVRWFEWNTAKANWDGIEDWRGALIAFVEKGLLANGGHGFPSHYSPGEWSEDPLLRSFIDQWRELYKHHFGRAYEFDESKDGPAAKELLISRPISSSTPSDDVLDVATKAWSRPHDFNCKQAVTISGLFNRWNHICFALDTH